MASNEFGTIKPSALAALEVECFGWCLHRPAGHRDSSRLAISLKTAKTSFQYQNSI
jgi:hypothetical protein